MEVTFYLFARKSELSGGLQPHGSVKWSSDLTNGLGKGKEWKGPWVRREKIGSERGKGVMGGL